MRPGVQKLSTGVQGARVRVTASHPPHEETTTVTTDRPTTDGDRTTRRRALLGLGAMAATGAAGVVVAADARPAAAGGQGEALTLGDPFNTAGATTALATTLPDTPSLVVQNAGGSDAVVGISGGRANYFVRTPAAVLGESDRAGVAAVAGLALHADAVVGRSADEAGVRGETDTGRGVIGLSKAGGVGVWGQAEGPIGYGVHGAASSRSSRAAGVFGTNPDGVGVMGGGRVPLRLQPASTTDLPSNVEPGSFHVDAGGALRFAPATGRWRTIAGPATAGALHVLPAPVRAYDSRPGTRPSVGPKTKVGTNQTRVLDLRAAIPPGATAVLLTVLLVNATAGNGNFTVWANGVAKPLANSLVWGGNAGRFTTTPTTAVDTAGRVQVHASLATDLVLDVVGYYA